MRNKEESMKTIEISDLNELFYTVRTLNEDNRYWFRGHSDVAYILNPSAFRKLYIIADQYGRPVKPRLLEFYDNSGDQIFLPDKVYLNSFFDKMEEEKIEYDKSLNLIDKYCFAQHYGVWTPMLDWTTDLSVALFFACDGRYEENACAIFLLDPKKWNEDFTGEHRVFTSDEVIKRSGLFPLAMHGKKSEKRICRQSGNFTVHGTMVWPLEKYTREDEDTLIKIIIPSGVARELNLYLDAFGINSKSIYVEKDQKDDLSKKLKMINETTLNKILNDKLKEWENTPDKDKGISRQHFY